MIAFSADLSPLDRGYGRIINIRVRLRPRSTPNMLGTLAFTLAVANAVVYAVLMRPVGERSHDLGDRTTATVRMTVQEAAETLGITVEAVRGRMYRGKYGREKDDEGRVYVLLTPDQLPNVQEEVKERSSERSGLSSDERSDEQSRTFRPTVYKRKGVADPELVEELRGEVAYLKEIISTRDEELRRKDTIIMQMAQRIPELEAPHESRDGHETDSEHGTGGDSSGSQEPAEHRSWWRRWFGFE